MSLVLPVFTGRFFDESEAGFSYLSGRVQEIAHCRCLNHRYLAHCRCFTAERNPKRRKCDELYHCLSQIRDGTCQAQVSLYTIWENKVYTAWCGPCLSIAGILRMPVAKFMQIMQGLHIDWVIWVMFQAIFSEVPTFKNLQVLNVFAWCQRYTLLVTATGTGQMNIDYFEDTSSNKLQCYTWGVRESTRGYGSIPISIHF